MFELQKIYSAYFAILEKYYFQFYNEAKNNKISSEAIAYDVKTNHKNLFEKLVKVTPIISESIANYWGHNYKKIYDIYSSLSGVKTRFGGDIGPQKSSKIIEKVGIYFDTIIIPDPMQRIIHFPTSYETKTYYLLKYAINQLYYKKAFVNSIIPPIALLIPDKELVGKTKYNFSELTRYSVIDTLIILNALYNQNLNTVEEANNFLSKFKNIDQAYKEIIRPDIIWWNEDYDKDILSQLESIKKNPYKDLDRSRFPYDYNDPRFLLFQLTGRMMQINDVLVQSSEIGANPLITAPVSFHWMKMKVIENQKLFLKDEFSNSHLSITNAFLSKNNKWLGNISLEDLIRLREKGLIQDFRIQISSEYENYGEFNIENMEKFTTQIDYNLANLFRKHKAELDEIQKLFRTELSLKGVSFLASLTVALQPLIGNFLPNWSTTIGGLTGFSTLSEIVSGVIAYLKKQNKLKHSPIGILFKAKND